MEQVWIDVMGRIAPEDVYEYARRAGETIGEYVARRASLAGRTDAIPALIAEVERAGRTHYVVEIDGTWGGEEILRADSLDDAVRQAEEWAQDGEWDRRVVVSVWVARLDAYDRMRRSDDITHETLVNESLGRWIDVEVGPEPEVPPCTDGREHDWCAPYEVVGGIRENPGVWGIGAGVVLRRVCRHCGRYRVTESQPGCSEKVEYKEPDERSRAWVEASVLRRYEIHSRHSGAYLGTYEGATPEDAVEALARDAGYDSATDMDARTGQSWRNELVVEEVE